MLKCQGDETVQALEKQVQDLQQQVTNATEHLNVVHADLAAAQIEQAGKEEILQEYIQLSSQLTDKLEAHSATIRHLHESEEQLKKELSVTAGAMALTQSELTDECSRHKACQENCDMIGNDLNRLKVCS